MPEARELREKFILTVIFTLIAAIFAGRIVLRPLLRNNLEIKRELRTVNIQLHEAREKSKNLVQLRTEYEAVLDRVSNMNMAFFNGNELHLTKKIWLMAADAGLAVIEFSPGKSEDRELSRVTGYFMRFTGSFPDFYYFLRSCDENFPVNIGIRSVKIVGTEFGTLNGEINLVVSALKE
ncbi:MAG: type 4a pilus biogenesis protein PilO [Candidatus Wallbacteria bacterium]|nr:type 4a pilus biogenesis protein PilO [Candidatus Wallbacteria bacterium]